MQGLSVFGCMAMGSGKARRVRNTVQLSSLAYETAQSTSNHFMREGENPSKKNKLQGFNLR